MPRVRRPVEDLSDSELVLASVDRAGGTAEACGCLTVFAGGLALAIALRETGSAWSAITSALCPAALVAMGGTLAWAAASSAIRRRSSAPYQREFLRRAGVSSRSSGEGAVDHGRVVVMLSGRALPHGGTRTVWLSITTELSPSGELVHAAVPYAYASGSKMPRVGEAALPPAIAAEVAEAIAVAETSKDRPKLSGERDGFPFSIELHRVGLDRPTTLSGNLAARNWREDAGCRLADVVLRAADALGAKREPFGACSADGDITLGER